MKPILTILLLFLLVQEASGLSGVQVAGEKMLREGECLEVRCDSGVVKSVEIQMAVDNGWRRSGIGQPLCRMTMLADDSTQLADIEIKLGKIRNADDDTSRRFLITIPGSDGDIETTVEASTRYCTLQLMKGESGDWEVWFGDDAYTPAGMFACSSNVAAVEVKALTATELLAVNLDSRPLPEPRETKWKSAEEIESYLAEAPYDLAEGIYTYMDCDLDTRRARRGGDYRIAVIKAETGYDLIYLDGADVNAGEWQAGMRKGHAEPTLFQDNYTLGWTDATGNADFEGAWASLTGAIMELHFPAESATLRFMRQTERMAAPDR